MTTLTEFITSNEVFVVITIAIAIFVIGIICFVIERIYKKHKGKNSHSNKKIIITDNRVEVTPILDQIITDIPKQQVSAAPVSIELEKNVKNVGQVMPIVEEKKVEPVVEQEEIKVEPVVEQEEIKVEPVVEQEEIKVEPVAEQEEIKVEPVVEQKEIKIEPVVEEIPTIENIFNEVKEQVEIDKQNENIVYTDIEPNPAEAKEEIRKATEELLKTQELQKLEMIDLAKFEEEQEENAIISLDELYNKSKNLYAKNEITQYEDEGNEPISLEDLEARMNKIKVEANELEQENPKEEIKPVEEVQKVVKLDDFNSVNTKEAYSTDNLFKSSPIISPIFGIKKNVTTNDIELENTANYEKLDEEIKKTNEFLKSLKELKKKLE